MKSWQKNLLIVAFLLSLLFHASTGVYVYFVQKPLIQREAIEVTIVEPDQKEQTRNIPNQAKQIVEQSEKQINDEIDEKARYLSRFNQKVIEQTKAANVGKFQNDAKEGPAPKKPVTQQLAKKDVQPTKADKTADKRSTDLQSGDVPLPKLSALKPQFQWEKMEVGVANPGLQSQTDDYLKDTKTGPQTLLSSREFVYYSYYSRIKERLRMFWEPKIKEKITRIFMSGRHIASAEERITRLVITLDNTGKLIRVQVMSESGLKDLDDAAVEAFQAAAPFPNPPKGIIDPDGTIKIRWDFILEAQAGGAIFRSQKVYAVR